MAVQIHSGPGREIFQSARGRTQRSTNQQTQIVAESQCFDRVSTRDLKYTKTDLPRLGRRHLFDWIFSLTRVIAQANPSTLILGVFSTDDLSHQSGDVVAIALDCADRAFRADAELRLCVHALPRRRRQVGGLRLQIRDQLVAFSDGTGRGGGL
jgi:hypothetical protein